MFAPAAATNFFGSLHQHLSETIRFVREVALAALYLDKARSTYFAARYRLVTLLRQWQSAYPTHDRQWQKVLRCLKQEIIAPLIAGTKDYRYFALYHPASRGWRFQRTLSNLKDLEDAIYDLLKRYLAHPTDRFYLLERLMERIEQGN